MTRGRAVMIEMRMVLTMMMTMSMTIRFGKNKDDGNDNGKKV